MAERKAPHSLQEQTADQIRNEQRGGAASPIDPNRDANTDSNPGGVAAEPNATMNRVGSEPGGEAQSYRSAMPGGGGKMDNQSDLTAKETPDTTKHLSDASLSARDKDATAEAIDRATAVNGKDER